MASSGTIGKFNTGGNDYLVASTAFATCSTAANTSAKVATIQDSASFTAIEGITVQVLFTYSNTAESPTLNINSTGAYPIYMATGVVPGLFAASSWSAGSIVSFTLHNNFWYMNDVKEDIFIIHVSDYDGQVTVQESSAELTNAVSRGAIPVIVWSDIDTTVAMIAQPQNLVFIQAFVAVNYANLIDINTLGANSNGSLGVYVVYWVGSQVPPTGISFQYGVENRNNKVTSISQSSTNTEYPSAAAVYSYVAGLLSNYVSDVTVDGTSVVSSGVAAIPTEVYNAETSTDYGYSIQQAFDAGKIVYYDITSNNISSFTCYRNGTQVSTNLYDFYGRYILTQASNDYTGGEGSTSGNFYFTRTDNNASPDTVPYQFTMFLFDDYGAWNTWEIYKVSSVRDVTVNGVSVLSDGSALITGDLTDTKNTAGSTDTSSKIFLIGATTQAANPQTYSDNQVYATNGQLDANKVRVAETATIQWNSTDSSLDFVFA